MSLNQYAIYQLKPGNQNRELRFRPWADVQRQGLSVQVENYQEVFLSTALPNDTPETIWKRFLEKPPKNFRGSTLSVSDVIVFNKAGITSAYYVDKTQLYTIAGFIRLNSSGSLVTIDTRDFQAEGVNGSWAATEEIIVDGRQFFLMQSNSFGKDVPFLVVDEQGKAITNATDHGFDEQTLQKIREFLHPTEPAEPVPVAKKMENWQKAFENGEYLRSAEMTEEANFNMIDGLANNRVPGKRKVDAKHRPSVMKKLRQKQKEIAARNGKLPEQQIENPMERKRQ